MPYKGRRIEDGVLMERGMKLLAHRKEGTLSLLSATGSAATWGSGDDKAFVGSNLSPERFREYAEIIAARNGFTIRQVPCYDNGPDDNIHAYEFV